MGGRRGPAGPVLTPGGKRRQAGAVLCSERASDRCCPAPSPLGPEPASSSQRRRIPELRPRRPGSPPSPPLLPHPTQLPPLLARNLGTVGELGAARAPRGPGLRVEVEEEREERRGLGEGARPRGAVLSGTLRWAFVPGAAPLPASPRGLAWSRSDPQPLPESLGRSSWALGG